MHKSLRRGDIVGVDVDRVPADILAGEGDGIGFGDQETVAAVDDGGVLAQRWRRLRTACGRLSSF